ncbi:MAG: hypothetical protein KAS32_21250, partial [Candidatus Peribacteraceae bacterium]|nr:hypothetical protein [Candidatus Peribacteraceae bacterium]
MFRTAECVTPMHPDKICDRISDEILDACLAQDPNSRVAIETMGGHGIITITGELTTEAYVDMREIARRITNDKYGVQVNVVEQSFDISKGVDTGGAGDQGLMVGYACNENYKFIPQELYLARDLCQFIYGQYQEDGKTQITLDENGNIKSVVASFCNVKKGELEIIIDRWIGELPKHADYKVHANPAG